MFVFMIALVLQYLFAYKLKIFPVSGYETAASMVLPSIVLVELGRKYCQNDKVKYLGGNAGRLYKDCQGKGTFRVCCNEVTCSKECDASCKATMMALQISSMLSGAVITENIPGIPGIGRLAVNAIETRDMPLLLERLFLQPYW